MFDLATFAAISPGINEFPITINADDLTVVWTVRTNDFACHEFHFCHIKAERFFNSASQCKDCCSVAAHQMSVIIYDNFFSQRVCKGLYYAFIFTYSTLEYDWSKYFLTFSNII